MPNLIARAIDEAGGTRAVALALDMSEWGVRKWVHDGIPAKHVIALAELGGWRTTPHELAPSLYPHPDDGLPAAARQCNRKGAA
jgi:hypothetical protein